jgi:SAM-dependent methyltransferase
MTVASTTECCVLCGGPLREELGDVPDTQTGDVFHVARCARCGLGTTSPAPADLSRYYGERYYGSRHGITNRWCVRRRLRLVERASKGPRPRKLADIGCGDGSFLRKVREAGWTVMGTEVDPSITAPGLEVHASLEELRLRAPFGCITLWHSLEHLRNPIEAIGQLAGMLAPGGTLVVAVPDSGGYQARLYGRHWLHLDVPRHLYHFSLTPLRAAVERAGLEVIRVGHQEIEYDVFGWIQSALNRVMPRPNILFDALTGRPRRVSRSLLAANVLLAALGLLPASVATFVSSWRGAGGTIVVVARRAGGGN